MKILIIEDDSVLSDTIKQCIEDKYNVEQAYDGEEGLLYAEQKIYDLIILDIMMPIKDGYEVLTELRNHKVTTPVLILTAKDSIHDKILGFRSGADDYLVKPFQREELLLRIEAIVRRSNGLYEENRIYFKDLELNLSNRQAKVGEISLNLQGKQFAMLEYLMTHQNSILTKDQIFDKIWGFNSETSTNVTEVYASGIRKELKKVGYDRYLKTIRGVGYMITEV